MSDSDKIIDFDIERKKKLISKIRECDSLHNNCDYLLEHNECDDIVEYFDQLQQKNKELKKINTSLQIALSITQQKYNNDKARYRRKYQKNRHIIKEFEKWLEEEINKIKKMNIDILNPIHSDIVYSKIELKCCLNKLQEIKEK